MLTQAIVPISGIAIDSLETKKSHQILNVKRNHFGGYTLNYSFMCQHSELNKIRIEPGFEKKIVSKVINRKNILENCQNFARLLKDLNLHKSYNFNLNEYSQVLNLAVVHDENHEIFTMRMMQAQAIMYEKISTAEAKRRQIEKSDRTLTDFHNFALHLVNQNLPEEKRKTDIPFEHATNIMSHLVSSSITKYNFRNGIDCVYREPLDKHERPAWPKEKIKDLPASEMDHYLQNIHRSVTNAKEIGIGRRKGLTPVTASRRGLDALNLAIINHHVEHGNPGLPPEIIHAIATFKNQKSLFKLVA